MRALLNAELGVPRLFRSRFCLPRERRKELFNTNFAFCERVVFIWGRREGAYELPKTERLTGSQILLDRQDRLKRIPPGATEFAEPFR